MVKFEITISRGHIYIVAGLLLAALLGVPSVAAALHTFSDVSDSSIFHEDIAWLSDSGVTLGCNPPDNTSFCPAEQVTREQLAAFLHRLAVNRVVDAGTLDGWTKQALTPRVAVAQGIVTAGEDGGDLSREVTIEAPGPGTLVMTGNAIGGLRFGATATDATYTCNLDVDFDSIVGTHTTSEPDSGCMSTGSYSVDAGTHEVMFRVDTIPPETHIASISLWAIWIPLDGSGLPPTPCVDGRCE